MAKDRQPRAWSSLWAKWTLVLLVWGTGTALASFVLGKNWDSISWFVLLSTLFVVDHFLIMRTARQADNAISPETETSSQARVDTEARQRAERILEQALNNERETALRLREIDQAKNDFVASVSNELCSPLASTMNYLQLLASGEVGELTPEQARIVDASSENAKRLETLIQNLLTLSRIESGAYRVQFRPLNLRSLLESAIGANRMSATERNISLSLHCEDDMNMVAGDNVELNRGLRDLVENAVKFTPPGGFVDVSVQRTTDHVLVIVKDTGIGIPSEEQARLFDRFYRASAAIEHQYQGAGLSLTLAKAVFEHHGGTIHVQSEVAKGTTVTVELPKLVSEQPGPLATNTAK